MRRALARGAPFVWLMALAIALTWPAVLLPDALLGHAECSAGCHAWLLWFTRHALLPSGSVSSDLLFFPHGGDVLRLYGSDVLSPLLLAPLARVLAPWSLFNLWALFMVLANGLAMYALARDRQLSTGAAAVAATVFQAAPFFQQELLNGTTELVASAALPLFTLGWLRLLERPERRWGFFTGFVFGLGGLASVYAPFFMLLLAAVLVGHRLVVRWQAVLTPAFGRVLLAAALPAVGLLAPLLDAHWRHGAGAIHARRVDWSPERVPLPDSAADLLGLLDPRTIALPVNVLQGDGSVYAYWTLGSVFLGFVALVLAAVGVWRLARDGRALGPWLALLVAALLVALGPYLVVGGELVKLAGSPVPLPSLAIRELLPPFSLTALHTYRYTAVAVLALAMLAGQGVAALPWRAVAPWAALGVAAEALLFSPSGWPLPTTPVPASATWDTLAAQPTGGLVLMPFSANDLGDLSWGLLAQTRHGQPWSDGGIHFRTADASLATYADNSLLAWLADETRVSLPPEGVSAAGFRRLAAVGFCYLVVDRGRLAPWPGSPTGSKSDAAQVVAWAQHHLGAPVSDDGNLALFLLSPATMEQAP